jgi:hypothetical protein
LPQKARPEQTKSASEWLSGEIENLHNKVAEAESRVEDFRSKSSPFAGTHNTSCRSAFDRGLGHCKTIWSNDNAAAVGGTSRIQGRDVAIRCQFLDKPETGARLFQRRAMVAGTPSRRRRRPFAV